MKTLRLTLTDLELGPLGDTHRVTGEAWARYTREVRTTDGALVVLAQSRKTVPSTGVVEWSVLPNDDPAVHPDDAGFGIEVGWDLYLVKAAPPGRSSLNPDRVAVTGSRTVAITTTDPAVVPFTSKSTATPADPLVTYLTEGQANAAYAPAAGSSVYTAQGADATQRLMALLATKTRDASILVVGDSTGNDPGEWVDKLTRSLAADFPAWTVQYRLWNDGSNAYDAASTIQTGTGPRTFTVYNASIAGASCTGWQAPRHTNAIAALAPDLTIISLGHNEQIVTPEIWHSRYVGLVEQIASRLTMSPILLIAQNPATADTNQQLRREIYREIALFRGYGFIDVCKAFEDNGTNLTVDGIHPNATGQQLWHDTVKRAFTYQRGAAPRTQTPSTLLMRGENLLSNPGLTLAAGVPTDWAMAGATAAIDTVNFESATYDRTTNGSVVSTAVKFTASGAGGTLRQYLPIKKVAGRWVTFAARIYVPAGQSLTVGRLALTAQGSAAVIQSSETAPYGSFRWAVVSRFIPATATSAEAFVYIDSAGTGAGNCTIDRVSCVVGKFPMAGV